MFPIFNHRKKQKNTVLSVPIQAKQHKKFQNTLAQQLETVKHPSNLEIERKWLFNERKFYELSKQQKYDEFLYEQSYLSTNPEIRIRKKEKIEPFFIVKSPATYKLCIKSKDLLCRTEIEKDLTESEYKALLKLIDGPIIQKQFLCYPIIDGSGNTHQLTIGLVKTEQPFCYGEIEFESESEANQFQAPIWFGPEVTKDPKFKMAAIYEEEKMRKETIHEKSKEHLKSKI